MELWLAVYFWNGKRAHDFEPRVFSNRDAAEKHVEVYNKEQRLDRSALIAVLYHAIAIEV